jgi:hypothetical protein
MPCSTSVRRRDQDRGISRMTVSYTRNSGFPGQFAQANRIAHRWMFTGAVPSGNSTDQWLIDVAPMLSDPSFDATLGTLDLHVPPTLTVPITVDSPGLQPGKLRWLTTWGPWASIAAALVAGVFALLTLAAARSKGKGLTALGVSALLVGAAGWAGIEVGRRFIEGALNRTTGDIRTVAEVIVARTEDSLHLWLYHVDRRSRAGSARCARVRAGQPAPTTRVSYRLMCWR